MIDVRNNGNITGRLVADPELMGNDKNVARFRIAADFAGNDRTPDANEASKNTGFFNVTMFLNDDTFNTRFVKDQIEKGNLSKGSQVQVLYRLQQDRWEKDGQKFQNVGLIAESLTYAGSPAKEGTGSSSGSQQESAAEMPNEF